ncbi:hypothetical protein MRB53_021171 [Persea americana]|uniref:Uncharacterized protein n=1 Tax=Persea americana TaxID=3435 RepID=A0ACC2L335_PERAE|nr:hypothetical protein MRB53_021171 [Persea americana]
MAQILSFKTLVISTIVFLFTALLLKLTIPANRKLVTSVFPPVWSTSLLSQLKTFNLFLIINAIIIAIAASSGFHHKAQDPREIRQDPGELDADAHGPPHAEEEEEEDEDEEETGSFEMKVADPSMSSQDPTEIRVDPNSLDATAYEESEEEHFADCKSDWIRELRDPTERPVCAFRVGNRKSMKASSQGRKALEITRPTSNETLESVWKRIMENSNKCDTSDPPQSDLISIQRSSLSPFLNSPKPKKPLPRQPPPSRDELNRQVQGFINKFNEQMRQQRQDIDQSE